MSQAPIHTTATNRWFKVPHTRLPLQRYEEAPPNNGTVHWYWSDRGWRAFRTTDVTEVKRP